MKIFLRSLPLIVILAVGHPKLSAQTGTSAMRATVQFGNGQTIATDDFSDPIGVQPAEVVSVTIQFASELADEAVNVESLDGGRISNASTAVSDEGAVTFAFQAPGGAGQNRVVIRHGLETLRVQFWVLSSNPQNNPPVITSVNSEG